MGDFSDAAKISALSREHDIAVNAGNSFTGDLVAAIIAGQKAKEPGYPGKLIHISGAGNFIDFGTSGNFNPESKVWNDYTVEDIKAIHKGMFNGQSDTLVLEAGADNAVETYILCPSVVYGGASVSSPTMGIGYTLLTGNAKPLGYVPYVGDGTAVLSTVCDTYDFDLFIPTFADLFCRLTSSIWLTFSSRSPKLLPRALLKARRTNASTCSRQVGSNGKTWPLSLPRLCMQEGSFEAPSRRT